MGVLLQQDRMLGKIGSNGRLFMPNRIHSPPRRRNPDRGRIGWTGRALSALSLLAASSVVWGCGPIDRIARIQINEVPVTVELALSEDERACGLSFRDSLADDHGMLFVFPGDRIMTFWMKDTRIPLSIAFLTASGTILNILEMKPMDETERYRSSGPARFALEMPAQWFAEHRVKPGDRIMLNRPASQLD
jgi:uncharacterized membrane protein (UPF0127 family)